jgi:ATP-dependent DNA helicase DinG
MTEEQNQTGIMRHFVLAAPREKQVVAMEYIERKYAEGFRDIVIAAPTGIGKSAIGASACFWSQAFDEEGFEPGGYYLVTQKLLQDQLSDDFKNYQVSNAIVRCKSLKSSSEYRCMIHGNCSFGMNRKNKCPSVKQGTCAYIRARSAWQNAMLSVTNYPYLFTEHTTAAKLLPRRVLVMDECHTLERQILKFVEVSVTQEGLRKWAPTIKHVPQFEDLNDFAAFLIDDYLPIVKNRLDALANWEGDSNSDQDRKIQQEKMDLETHWGKTLRGAKLILDDPSNWVFYQEENRKHEMEAYAKPLDASPFGQEMVFGMGHVRIYMSAYPGSKPIFCRSLGLDPEAVAWLNLNSTFPVENRQIYMTLSGSMSKRNRAENMPRFLRYVEKILATYSDTKGIIHCNSYDLGEDIMKGLRGSKEFSRLLFPQNSDERDPVFKQHKFSEEPTVIVTPSMTEGFDFSYDLARWQIISKVPFPYLGDRQVAAKKELDPDWYDLEAVKSIIQACGRIVRSDTDIGHTYILDSDFVQLWERRQHMFPKWWCDAVVWPKRQGRG